MPLKLSISFVYEYIREIAQKKLGLEGEQLDSFVNELYWERSSAFTDALHAKLLEEAKKELENWVTIEYERWGKKEEIKPAEEEAAEEEAEKTTTEAEEKAGEAEAAEQPETTGKEEEEGEETAQGESAA